MFWSTSAEAVLDVCWGVARGLYPDQSEYYDDTGVGGVVGAGVRGVNSDYQTQRGGGGAGGVYPPSGSAAQLSAADADFQDMRQRYDEDY